MYLFLKGGLGGGGGAPGEILKTKNAGEAISGHFAMRLKSQIYLNYAYLQIFQRRKSPFIPCFLNVFEAGRASSVGCTYRLVSRRSRVRSSLPAHSFVEICMGRKKILQPLHTCDRNRDNSSTRQLIDTVFGDNSSTQLKTTHWHFLKTIHRHICLKVIGNHR